jgi:hypothetical protein
VSLFNLAWIQVSGSMRGPESDDNVGRLGLVRLQLGLIAVAPVSDIHNFSPPSFGSRQSSPGRLHDVESVAVEEECVFPEQADELRNHRMVVRNCLRVRSTCAEVSFIAHSCFGWARAPDAKPCDVRMLRGLPPQVVKREANSVIPQALT